MEVGRAVLVVCVLLALPTAVLPDSPLAGYAYLVGLAAVVAGLTEGTRRCRGRSRRAWLFVTAAAWCWLVGDTVQRVMTAYGYAASEPGPADVFWLASYPLLVSGVAVMIGGRGLPAIVRRELRLDTTAVTVAVALAAWQLLIAPEVAGDGITLTTALAVLYPLGDVAVFAMGVTLLLTPGRRGTPAKLIIAALGSTLVVDVVISGLLTLAPQLDVARLDAVLLVVNALLAVAVLHPDHESLVAPAPRTGVAIHMHRGRVVLLGGALVAVSVTSALPVPQTPLNRVLLLLAAVTVSVTVLLRFLEVVRQRENAEARLTHQALHDPLTGLANRSFLVEHLRERLAGAGEGAGLELAMFYIDLDGFKRVNDQRGHSAGDEVLRVVAQRLVGATRHADVVARLGGDEFVVLAHDVPAAAAQNLADKLVAAVRVPIALPGDGGGDGQGHVVEVGASVGVYAPWTETVPGGLPTGDVEQWLRAADAAMYSAKQSGGGVHLVGAGR